MSWQYLEKDDSENIKRINTKLSGSLGMSILVTVISLLGIPLGINIVFACVIIILCIALSVLGNKAISHYTSLKHSYFDFALNITYAFEMFVVSIVVMALNPRMFSDVIIIFVAIVLFLITVTFSYCLSFKRYKNRHLEQKEKLPFSEKLKKDGKWVLIFMPLIWIIFNDIGSEKAPFVASCSLFLFSMLFIYYIPSSIINLYHELKLSRGEVVEKEDAKTAM